MIDFNSDSVFKLTRSKKPDTKVIEPLLITGEEVLSQYQTIRDSVTFTNKRIIALNVQGITGKKKDFTSLPYSKIQAFSIETAGTFDMDSELEIYFSGLGKVKFEFSGENNALEIGKLISEKVL
ncbi:MAG TPA: PH domain-containing protein [Candidatus Fimicola cottocaccae]|nr:PH domain-containing protein [Candidatus Fimicola cottocaccae]